MPASTLIRVLSVGGGAESAVRDSNCGKRSVSLSGIWTIGSSEATEAAGVRVFVYPKGTKLVPRATWRTVSARGSPSRPCRDGGLLSAAQVRRGGSTTRRRGSCAWNASLIGEKNLYREKFGEHLFDDPNRFPGTLKYTLEVLRDYGADSLSCGDIEGIESIVLTQVELAWGGPIASSKCGRRRTCSPRCRAVGDRCPNTPDREGGVPGQIHGFENPRTVKIKPDNIAEYTRDADAVLIERWLELRGFVEHVEPATQSPAHRFWSAIESITGRTAVAEEWRRLLGDEFERCADLLPTSNDVSAGFSAVGGGFPMRLSATDRTTLSPFPPDGARRFR